jgi:hypothetical protein
MERLVWKLRISLLWGAVAVLTMLHMLLDLAAPGAIDDLRAGEINGMDASGPATIMWVLFVLVPLVLSIATLVVPDVDSRWANAVLGVILAGAWAAGFTEGGTAGAPLLTTSVIIASLLVVWHAWKWPTQRPVEAEQGRAPDRVAGTKV